jgi:CheY-like chemotaxis protein
MPIDAGVTSDLNLVALCVVIWVVAISVAFGFYLPVLRGRGKQPVGPSRPAAPSAVLEDLDHAPVGLAARFSELQAITSVAEPIPAPAVASIPEAVPEVVLAAIHQLVAAAQPPPEPPSGFNVLIVDDNDINRQVLEMILDSVGVAHVSVENGLEAVEAMAACPYQAVLMDLQMPVMDGFEATRRIRELEIQRGGAASSIIVVSANCLAEDVAATRAVGADKHLSKPISVAALLSALQTCPAGALLAA